MELSDITVTWRSRVIIRYLSPRFNHSSSFISSFSASGWSHWCQSYSSGVHRQMLSWDQRCGTTPEDYWKIRDFWQTTGAPDAPLTLNSLISCSCVPSSNCQMARNVASPSPTSLLSLLIFCFSMNLQIILTLRRSIHWLKRSGSLVEEWFLCLTTSGSSIKSVSSLFVKILANIPSQVADDIWVCENGTVTPWKGGIQAYKKSLKEKVMKADTGVLK